MDADARFVDRRQRLREHVGERCQVEEEDVRRVVPLDLVEQVGGRVHGADDDRVALAEDLLEVTERQLHRLLAAGEEHT